MCCENLDTFALTNSGDRLPWPEIVEVIIRKAIRTQYGDAYEALILNGLNVDSVDSTSLIMHTNSSFLCAVIQSRLVADIERVIADIYKIHPNIQISVSK